MFQKTVRTAFVLASFAMLSIAPAVSSGSEPVDILKYRQAMMKANGEHMSAANAILKGKVDYKNQLADHARAIEAINKDIPALFPKGSDVGETRALEGVWKNRAEFEKYANNTRDKAAAFAKAVAAGDPQAGAKYKELDDACSECHEDFRKKRKKS